jgi:hypothetical protein
MTRQRLLVSTGSRNHVVLFSIYTLLNFEILVLAFKRNWRILSLMGFFLTVLTGTLWGARDWRPELFASVEPFLLIFLATYTLIAIADAGKEDDGASYLMAIGVPFSFFFLQMRAAGHFEYGMALSCLGLGMWHLAFGAWLRPGHEPQSGEPLGDQPQETPGALNALKNHRLSRLYMLLCLLFSNLVVPYTFGSALSSAIWAAEGAFAGGGFHGQLF